MKRGKNNMAEYIIHNIELSQIEKDICDGLSGVTFEAKNDVEAELKAYEMLKEKLADCLSEQSFEIDFQETVELQSGMKI